MIWRWFLKPTLFALLLPALCFSQSQDSLQFRFYHGVDEFSVGSLFFADQKKNAISAQMKGSSSANYRRPMGSQGELKTSGDVDARIGRILRPSLELQGIVSGDFYRLERFDGPTPILYVQESPVQNWNLESITPPPPVPQQLIERGLLGAACTFTPDSLLKLSTELGHQWERRSGFDDRGVSASFSAELSGFEFKGYRNDAGLFLEQEELGARMNRDLRFGYGLDKEFSSNSSDQLEIYYRQKRHDYHIWGGSSIGTRTDTEQKINNRLRYDPYSDFRFYVDTELAGSSHEDRTGSGSILREEVRTANALTLQRIHPRLSGQTSLQFDWGVHEDATGLKRERGTSLEGGISWTPGSGDTLSFQSVVRKRQYDTSDTSNYDDRDRLRYELDLNYSHQFSPYMSASSLAEVTLEHLVYIYAQKSDQNYWNRIFRLRPVVSFKPHQHWRNISHFELVANMTDYDYELNPVFIKSTIYRRYSAGNQLQWFFDRGWIININYALDLEDGGRLVWEEWMQQISEEYRTHTASLILSRETQVGVRYAAGMNLYERKGWEYTSTSGGGTMKLPFLYLSRWGPMLQITYPSSSALKIEANGDLSWVHEWNREDYTLVNLDVRITLK